MKRLFIKDQKGNEKSILSIDTFPVKIGDVITLDCGPVTIIDIIENINIHGLKNEIDLPPEDEIDIMPEDDIDLPPEE